MVAECSYWQYTEKSFDDQYPSMASGMCNGICIVANETEPRSLFKSPPFEGLSAAISPRCNSVAIFEHLSPSSHAQHHSSSSPFSSFLQQSSVTDDTPSSSSSSAKPTYCNYGLNHQHSLSSLNRHGTATMSQCLLQQDLAPVAWDSGTTATITTSNHKDSEQQALCNMMESLVPKKRVSLFPADGGDVGYKRHCYVRQPSLGAKSGTVQVNPLDPGQQLTVSRMLPVASSQVENYRNQQPENRDHWQQDESLRTSDSYWINHTAFNSTDDNYLSDSQHTSAASFGYNLGEGLPQNPEWINAADEWPGASSVQSPSSDAAAAAAPQFLIGRQRVAGTTDENHLSPESHLFYIFTNEPSTTSSESLPPLGSATNSPNNIDRIYGGGRESRTTGNVEQQSSTSGTAESSDTYLAYIFNNDATQQQTTTTSTSSHALPPLGSASNSPMISSLEDGCSTRRSNHQQQENHTYHSIVPSPNQRLSELIAGLDHQSLISTQPISGQSSLIDGSDGPGTMGLHITAGSDRLLIGGGDSTGYLQQNNNNYAEGGGGDNGNNYHCYPSNNNHETPSAVDGSTQLCRNVPNNVVIYNMSSHGLGFDNHASSLATENTLQQRRTDVRPDGLHSGLVKHEPNEELQQPTSQALQSYYEDSQQRTAAAASMICGSTAAANLPELERFSSHESLDSNSTYYYVSQPTTMGEIPDADLSSSGFSQQCISQDDDFLLCRNVNSPDDCSGGRNRRKLIRPSRILCYQLQQVMPMVIRQFETSSASRKGLCRQLAGQLYPNSPKPSPNFLLNTLLPVFRAANSLGFNWAFHLTSSLSYLRLWVCNQRGGKELIQRFRVQYNAPTGKDYRASFHQSRLLE